MYAMRDQAGSLSSESMERNKVRRLANRMGDMLLIMVYIMTMILSATNYTKLMI